MNEDRRAVLGTEVGPLTIQLSRIVVLPENFQQLVVRQLGWIVVHFHSLGVSGAIGADVFVSRIGELSAGVTHAGGIHTWQLAKCGFDSPKTAGGEWGFGHDNLLHLTV